MNLPDKLLPKNNFWSFCIVLVLCQFTNQAFYKSASINDGFFFGLAGNNQIALIISSVVIIIMIWRPPLTKTLSIVLAGALSNIIDRFIYGGILDYWNLWLIPTFNLADVLIVGGIGVLVAGKFTKLRQI